MSIREQFGHYLGDYKPEISADVDEEPVSAWIGQVMLEGIRDLDPTATMQGIASIRLTGRHFASGVFDAVAADIFTRIDREVRAAMPTPIAKLPVLGFRAVAAGSVVLPLAPFPLEAPASGQIPLAPTSEVERALRRVLDFHDAMEHGLDPASLGDVTGLAKQMRQLVASLDKVDAGLEIDLAESNGRRRVSHLTQIGRENVVRLFNQRRPGFKHDVVAGLLHSVALRDEFAIVELRPQAKRKVTTVITEVPVDVAKQLEWDTLHRILVRTKTAADPFGVRNDIEHQFIERIEHEDPLPGI